MEAFYEDKTEPKKILVADDDVFVIKALTHVLTKEGFEVYVAFNGIEAKEKITAIKPAILILDIDMPKMNGIEVLEWMKEESFLKIIYVIVLSGGHNHRDPQSILEKGANEYMPKPFSPTEIVQKIKELMPTL